MLQTSDTVHHGLGAGCGCSVCDSRETVAPSCYHYYFLKLLLLLLLLRSPLLLPLWLLMIFLAFCSTGLFSASTTDKAASPKPLLWNHDRQPNQQCQTNEGWSYERANGPPPTNGLGWSLQDKFTIWTGPKRTDSGLVTAWHLHYAPVSVSSWSKDADNACRSQHIQTRSPAVTERLRSHCMTPALCTSKCLQWMKGCKQCM